MDSRLLEKFYSGACSPEEVAAVLAWFEKEGLQPGQEQDLFLLWQEAGHQVQDSFDAQETDRILAGINQAIDGREAIPGSTVSDFNEVPGPVHQRGNWPWVLKVAAAVLLPVCFIWLFTCYFAAEKSVVSRLISQEAPQGTRKTIGLTDGSVIILSAGSKITYPLPFAADKREITLHGEAFFEVAKDSRRPFIVRTGNLITEALGTSFNIRYRVQENTIAVALATGVVKIEEDVKAGSNQIARLVPGEQLIYDQVKQGYAVSGYDSLEVLAWHKGVLYFKKANLNQVVQKLESWYGVELDIETEGKATQPEKKWLYTGTYDNQRLEDVLTGISFVMDFTYEKRGNKMILKFN